MNTTITESAVVEQIEDTSKRPPAPKLICVITGKSRPTNAKYLESKAWKRNVSCEHFASFYACKQAVTRLRAGKSVDEVRAELEVNPDAIGPIDSDQLKTILRLNGKIKQS
jgi:hypothetical protein